MASDSGAGTDGTSEVVASVDRGDGRTEFVVADITTDGQWVAIPYGEALALEEWR